MPDDTNLSSVAAAIDAALKCDWDSAVKINLKIFKDNPTDADCLNRLGKSYLEQGDLKKAALYFHKVLKIDKYNPIATKNLARTTSPQLALKGKKLSTSPTVFSGPANFLEEPGKTRLVSLINVAPATILLKQDHADTLTLLPKRHTVVVQDCAGNYLGALPDDLGHRLSILIKGGNRYEAIAKSVSRSGIMVFLREVCRCKKFLNTPSFLLSNSADYLSFVREDLQEAESSKAAIVSDLDDSESADGQDEEPRNKMRPDDDDDT